jgi:hypothetical protein
MTSHFQACGKNKKINFINFILNQRTGGYHETNSASRWVSLTGLFDFIFF